MKHPNIAINTYRFYFKTQNEICLPVFAGSAWRGALGHSLKRIVCVVRNMPCNLCLLKNACAYSIVFETPTPSNSEKMRKYKTAPHPFVIHFSSDRSLSFTEYQLDVILFGHGQRYLPYIIHALKIAGEQGIGGHRQVFHLEKVDDINQYGEAEVLYELETLKQQLPAQDIVIPTMPNKIKFLFHTPLRLSHDNKNVSDEEFNFGIFFNTLLRRQSMISYFYTDTPLEINFAELTTKARTIEFSSIQMEWFDWTRYSSRQETEINMGGLVGTVELCMNDLEDYWPYLWLGQWTHVGKGTSMGMGAYTIETLIA
jgi:CRISPR/Cas system endoribonuclease Cas6 (RAMP superfamily)